MRKFIYIFIIVAAVLTIGAIFTSCNVQVVDMKYDFDRAIISLPNGKVVEGEVESWKDYDDSDQIQVKIDGVTYYCHHSDVVLIQEAD